MEQRQRQQQDELLKCKQAITRHDQITQDQKLELQQAQSSAGELQDILDRDEVQPGRLDSLAVQLAEVEEDKTTYEGSYEELVIAKDAAFKSLRKIRDKMKRTDELFEEMETVISKAKDKVTRHEDERRDVLREKNAALEAVERIKAANATRSEARSKQLKIIQDFISEANKICARVPVDENESEESLQKKYDKLLRDLANAERR